MSMIGATYEKGFARVVAERVVFMDEGSIVVDQSPEEFFGNPTDPHQAAFLSKVLQQLRR